MQSWGGRDRSPAQQLTAGVEEGLKALATLSPEVEELYVFQMAVPHGQVWSSHTVIGIQLGGAATQDQKNEIVRRLGDGIQPKLDTGESLDFVVLSGHLAEKVREAGLLLFRRPKA